MRSCLRNVYNDHRESALVRAWVILPTAVLLLAVVAMLCGEPRVTSVQASPRSAATSSGNPDAVCAGCHRDIYSRYEQTPMARASGMAMDGLITGGFTHAASAISYRVFARDEKAWLIFDRGLDIGPGVANSGAGKAPLHGTRELEYFIGSNHRGRTYLYREGRQWYEAPINFYSGPGLWDMAPNFGNARLLPAALPTDANCLHCHATAVAEPLAQASNAFAAAPFAQGGIGCAACHGDPSRHLAQNGRGPIVNPAKLSIAGRDSACVQCHLEGDATVYRPGVSLAAFRPGDDLADFAVYFVKASRESGGGRASSQYEALLRSACRRASGDKLTCATCHDPHSSPSPAERVAWFRGRCLSCHNTPAIVERHHPEQPDCASCHMPSRASSDISHEQTTDHNIQRRPPTGNAAALHLLSLEAAPSEELVPVGSVKVGDRELGLAYAQLAMAGDRTGGERARKLLQRAEAAGADDASLHTQLGYLDQVSGDRVSAAREYNAALRDDPYATTAMGNLAVIDAASGHLPEAMQLLQRVVDADPGKTAAGLNLALIECSLGEKAKALDLLAQLRAVNPDDAALRTFTTTGVYGGQTCRLPRPPEGANAR